MTQVTTCTACIAEPSLTTYFFGQYPVSYQDTITLKDPPKICSYLLPGSAFLSATSQLPTKPTVCITHAINWDKNAADLLKTENDSEDKEVRKKWKALQVNLAKVSFSEAMGGSKSPREAALAAAESVCVGIG